MNVGVVGLGKLGLPLAATLAVVGHEVYATDIDPRRCTLKALSSYERGTGGTGRLLDEVEGLDSLHFVELHELVRAVDLILVVVATPHGPEFEGVTALSAERSDFDYAALTTVIAEVVALAPEAIPLGIVSTVLPGTTRRLILPLVGPRPVVYCPQFAAMGTVARDVLNAEFALLGCDTRCPQVAVELFESLTPPVVLELSLETAELSKIAYNTYISAKVAFANTVQLVSHMIGADAAGVFKVIGVSDRRLTSPAYLGPGMGDGGPCHPRDNIAMSWLAAELDVHADFFTAVMAQREAYVRWLADLWLAKAGTLPMIMLGTAYKPATDITTGSSSLLLLDILRHRQNQVMVIATADRSALAAIDHSAPAAFFLGCPEPIFVEMAVPEGSVIIDPWHVMPSVPGVEVVRVGSDAPVGSSAHVG